MWKALIRRCKPCRRRFRCRSCPSGRCYGRSGRLEGQALKTKASNRGLCQKIGRDGEQLVFTTPLCCFFHGVCAPLLKPESRFENLDGPTPAFILVQFARFSRANAAWRLPASARSGWRAAHRAALRLAPGGLSSLTHLRAWRRCALRLPPGGRLAPSPPPPCGWRPLKAAGQAGPDRLLCACLCPECYCMQIESASLYARMKIDCWNRRKRFLSMVEGE